MLELLFLLNEIGVRIILKRKKKKENTDLRAQYLLFKVVFSLDMWS